MTCYLLFSLTFREEKGRVKTDGQLRVLAGMDWGIHLLGKLPVRGTCQIIYIIAFKPNNVFNSRYFKPGGVKLLLTVKVVPINWLAGSLAQKKGLVLPCH